MDASGTTPSSDTLRGLAISTRTFARRWQHARGLCLALAFIRVALATHSGTAPRIGIYSPGVSNTLGGCASHWHLFARRWQHAQGLRLALAFLYSPDVGNTLRGCTFQPDASNTLGGYAYMLTLAFTLFVPGVSNTLGGCTLCCSNCTPSATSTLIRIVDTFRLHADNLTPR
jgi:hypothetical protein